MVKSRRKESAHSHKKARDEKKKSPSRSPSLSPSALLGFPKNHGTIDSVSFSTALKTGERSLVERYKSFVREQMKIVASSETQHCGMNALAKNEADAEDIGRYYLTKLSSTEGGAISVLTDKKDLYVVALASKEYVWYLKETVTKKLLKKVFPVNDETNRPLFVPLRFEGGYGDLETKTVGRDTMLIGFDKLDKWITRLSNTSPNMDNVGNISYTHDCSLAMKKGFLLLTQMTSETFRIKPLYQTALSFADPIHGKFENFHVDKFVVSCENKWGQMSDAAWERASLTDRLCRTFELSDSPLEVTVLLENGKYATVSYRNIVSTVEHVDETLGILKSKKRQNENDENEVVKKKEMKKKKR